MNSLTDILQEDIASRTTTSPKTRLKSLMDKVASSKTMADARKTGLSLLLAAATGAIAGVAQGAEPDVKFDTKFLYASGTQSYAPSGEQRGLNGVSQMDAQGISDKITELGKSGYEFKGAVVSKTSRYFGIQQEILVFQKAVKEIAEAASEKEPISTSLAGKSALPKGQETEKGLPSPQK